MFDLQINFSSAKRLYMNIEVGRTWDCGVSDMHNKRLPVCTIVLSEKG